MSEYQQSLLGSLRTIYQRLFNYNLWFHQQKVRKQMADQELALDGALKDLTTAKNNLNKYMDRGLCDNLPELEK